VASICFYFQVHQPFRLRRYSVFDTDRQYFDEAKNRAICQKVAHKCYLPANAVMLELIRRYEGHFRISYSLTGVVIEQFERYAPEVLDSFRVLNDTGCVEFITETYYHSLSFSTRARSLRPRCGCTRRRLRGCSAGGRRCSGTPS
jgi:alpha-amylase